MEIYQLKLCLTLACAPYRNDVCLLFTKEPFDLNGQTVKQLPIGTEDICHAGADCLVAGWGDTKVCTKLINTEKNIMSFYISDNIFQKLHIKETVVATEQLEHWRISLRT